MMEASASIDLLLTKARAFCQGTSKIYPFKKPMTVALKATLIMKKWSVRSINSTKNINFLHLFISKGLSKREMFGDQTPSNIVW